MGHSQDTTTADVALAYEAIVALGDRGELGDLAATMRDAWQRRTGSYGAEDPWFEQRSRAFWDDALASQGFAQRAAEGLGEEVQAIALQIRRAHRGFFLVEEVDETRATLVDVWSGAELLVRHLDDTQALTLEHAEGAMDARVTASAHGAELFLLPGAYHHAAEALEPAIDVLLAARERGMSTQATLDALMRMDLVFRSSSRVKAGFAYRVEGLVPRERVSVRSLLDGSGA